MKTVFSDFKAGIAKIRVEHPDDLWYLHSIIEKGDFVTGTAERKIKVGEKESAVRKKMTLSILVDKSDYDESTLRINGTTTEGSDDIPKGVYQAIEINVGDQIKIEKKQWYEYQKQQLKQASQNLPTKTMIVLFDREEAIFVLLKKYGYDIISKIEGTPEKKRYKEKTNEPDFFGSIAKQVEEYDKRYALSRIVLASQSFWKDEVAKRLSKKEKVISTTCSDVSKSAVEEILRKKEVQNILQKDAVSSEIKAVDEILDAIANEKPSAYGISEVENTVNVGNVRVVVATSKFLAEHKEKNDFSRVDSIMKKTLLHNGEVKIINSDNNSGKKIDGLGGIAAILKY